MVDVDLTSLFLSVRDLVLRFMNWHFELFGHTIYVYAIFGFAILTVIFIQFLRLIAGVSFD